jgi:hypothetical protein
MKATKHAVHAQNQRNYAKERIAGAKATFNNPWEERRFVFCFFCSLFFRNMRRFSTFLFSFLISFCIVGDYAQNLGYSSLWWGATR